jgi:hypothetical protein
VSGEIFSLLWFFKELKQLIEEQLTSWQHPYTSHSRTNIRWVVFLVFNSVGV